MKHKIFFALFMLFQIHLPAQVKEYTISGNVSDKTNIPISYANVMMKSTNDTIIYGDITDEHGNFNIQHLPKGKYLLTVSFVGYQPYQQEIELNENITLQIQLQEGIDLGEVIISAQRKLVTYDNGKINLTVENSKLANLPTTNDVLSFVPGIIVQGNDISVIGRDKTLILINGKEVKSNSQIESLQPEMIKNIVLDRNPSAKYDASYNSVIHITTKRNLGKDFSAQYIQGAAANRNFNHSETLNLNHTSGKLNNFLSYKFKNSKNTESANTYQNILLNDDIQSNSYDATMKDNNDNHSLALGSNIELNRNNKVDIQYFFNSGNQKAKITGWEQMEGITNNKLNVNRLGNSKEQDHTVNFSYSLTIDSIRSLQFFSDYTHLKNASIEHITSEEQETGKTGKDTLDNYSTFNTYSFRAEYNTKLFSDYDWMLGIRYSVIKSNSESGMSGDNAEIFFNEHSALTETNAAAYTTLSRKFNSFYTELGLRAEFTQDKYKKNEMSVFDKPRNSLYLFPSFLFNYDFSENLQLNLNYTSKIQRPSFYDLDPTLSYLSSVLYSQGNPELRPMVVHNIELSSVIERKFNVSIAYALQKNFPVSVIEPSFENANILLSKPINISKSSLLDFTATYIFFSGSFTSNLIGNLSIPFVEYPYMGKIEKSAIPLYQIVTMNQYSISPKIFLFCNFGFKSKYSSINTVFSPTYRLTIGANWILMRGKMILTLFGNDLLHKSEPTVISKYEMVDFGQSSSPDTRMVGITLKYNFNGFKNIFKKSDSNQQDIDRITK
ncbi:MAG: TonB-dependent receptor [Candidatus Azobacteroides sp.]|nr:TonB-dependent receptor [Candidatus Azobacteroides sp.]